MWASEESSEWLDEKAKVLFTHENFFILLFRMYKGRLFMMRINIAINETFSKLFSYIFFSEEIYHLELFSWKNFESTQQISLFFLLKRLKSFNALKSWFFYGIFNSCPRNNLCLRKLSITSSISTKFTTI